MKFYKKYFSLKHWLAFLRRQPNHMQHMYALLFSGVVTAILGAAILYFDYGFWHERYSRSEVMVTNTEVKAAPEVTTISPGEMLGSFFKEATIRVQAIKETTILEGKEIYLKEATTTAATTTTSSQIDSTNIEN